MLLTRHIFNFCGALAALSLMGIAVLILSQIGLRLMGSQIPSADDFAAWALSASIFLALPATLIHGDHIRVTSLRQLLSPKIGHIADILAAGFATVMMGWVAWAIFGYVSESWTYNELSQGVVAVPLWIPQSAMVLGSALFTVAFAERTVRLILRQPVEIQKPDALLGGE
ncbi:MULTISPECIES: TRAP transporter small permease [Pacificibacter]|uniref:TRAP transporter small permease n=1 Tax=Pacificibacter TaxID=1042323 RepID=UPI001C08D5E5|nr:MULTISPECIES: TRAP transporter small permease [Pacificibacter]MBU2937539.1 TRAP transporter small permease [Pacificibacter marinus]MDO6616670.1 TRAP transporter small permease [Pacificibacter sp. 1_MG-2023]